MTPLPEALAGHGIRLRDFHVGNHKTLCPKCSHTRKNKKDRCLSVTIDAEGTAVWNCHHCADTGNIPGKRSNGHALTAPRQSKPIRPEPVENPAKPERMFQWFTARGIGRETVDQMGCFVTSQWFPQTDQEERCIAFPYLRGGELVNHKYRTAAKQFRQDAKAERTIYNIDAVKDEATVIFVEGEMDVLACIEAGYAAVITLPDGAPEKAKDELDPTDKRYAGLAVCEAELEHVEKFILAGDEDGPGRAHAEEIARRLGKEKCWRVEWPAGNDAPRKDANEVLLEDGPEILRECIEAAKPYPIAGIYGVDDFRQEVIDLYLDGHGKGLSTGWETLDEYMTIREGGELAIATGIPGAGKSELIDALMVNLAQFYGWTFGLCSFENEPGEHVIKLAEKYSGAPFWDGSSRRMTRTDLDLSLSWIGDRFSFIRADDEAPTLDWVLEKARALVLRHGIRGLVIDPWNEVESRRPKGMNETEYVSQSLSKLKRFAYGHGVYVWLVAHPVKIYSEDGVVRAPTAYDISGSANFANKGDMIFTVHRPDIKSSGTEVHVRKVRRKWLGKPGMVRLDYDRATGRYSEVK